jgi:hypothetical protein
MRSYSLKMQCNLLCQNLWTYAKTTGKRKFAWAVVLCVFIWMVIANLPGPKSPQQEIPPSRGVISLRSNPITVSTNDFKKVFNLDENWRPKTFIENDYVDNGNGTVTNRATGLTWEKGGSKLRTYAEAEKYIQDLKDKKFGGYDDWRLPTIEELLSLLEKEKQSNNLYINPIFDSKQAWCWSADRLPSSGGAWYVYFYLGNVFWDLLDGKNCVRGVRARQ